MDNKHPARGPTPGAGTRSAARKHSAAVKRRLKIAKAAVVLVVILGGTVLPLSGVGLPGVDLPDLHLPFGLGGDGDRDHDGGGGDDDGDDGDDGEPTDTALPGWADRVLDVLKPVKNGIIALLVLAAAVGEYQRRRRASDAGPPTPPDESPEHPGDPEAGQAGGTDRADGERDQDPETGTGGHIQ